MNDFLDFIVSNEYFGIGLVVLLVVLVILFFVVLFSGNKKKVNKIITADENIDANLKSDEDNSNLDFDHNEYVKETTAEFELAPISEVMPNTSEEIPEVREESQAIKIESSNNEPVLKEFSFDELSKSIANELEKLKQEEDLNKEEEEIPEVNITKFDELASKVEISEPVFITNAASFKEENEIVLPKLANDDKKEEKNEEVKEELPEPILKDEEVPLFARFNQETYEINKKD